MEEQNKKRCKILQVECNHLWESLSEEDLSAVAGGAQRSMVTSLSVRFDDSVTLGGGKSPWGSWISCEENGST